MKQFGKINITVTDQCDHAFECLDEEEDEDNNIVGFYDQTHEDVRVIISAPDISEPPEEVPDTISKTSNAAKAWSPSQQLKRKKKRKSGKLHVILITKTKTAYVFLEGYT
jgi:hypothetical protein